MADHENHHGRTNHHDHHHHHHPHGHRKKDPHEEIIDELWSTYDKDHNSRIDRKEYDQFMKDICGMVGRKLTPACYDKLFKKADSDHSGYLSKTQFAKLIKENIV